MLAPTMAASSVSSSHPSQSSAVAVLWFESGKSGQVTVERGSLSGLQATAGTVDGGSFKLPAGQPGRLEIVVVPIAAPAELPTLVTITAAPRAFTFRLTDVSADFPIWLPRDGVVVTAASDSRTYPQIVAAIRARGGTTELQRIAAAPEASFAEVAAGVRNLKAQTWLGLSRDMRVFRVDENVESFQPRFAGYECPLPEITTQPATYAFQFGRGVGADHPLTRRLDEGALPILHACLDDGVIRYDVTLFAAPEVSPYTAAALRGTDYLVADAHGHGHMFTPAQATVEKARHDAELNPPEEVVLHGRIVATNRGTAPTYALFRTVTPTLATPISPRLPDWHFDPVTGFGAYASGRVYALSRLDGAPLPAEEAAVLLAPGASAVLEFCVPHRPLAPDRALALSRQTFAARLDETRAFWRARLAAAAVWELPEPHLQERVRAGLLHLDLVAYGREPDQPLLPAIGIYTAIGSESAPIIQFMDTMGWHDTAARALDFFLAKQHDDGFIQNFNGYMLETGAVLWTLGEHFRYTQDEAWLRRVHPQVTKAWRFLAAWRERNLQPELRGRGYGLLDGKTADPEDPYRSFMLNGYAYLGLARTAELLRDLAPEEAAVCADLAAALKADIRTSLDQALEEAPVVPLGDGRWTRAAAPWTGYRGPVMLHADGGRWYTHGTMTARDSLLGPLYLVFQEIVAPDEPIAVELLEVHAELMTRGNVAFSQPYYSRHPWVHLRRGETKAFLQAWYGALAALADRETYTFNEHLFPVSAHKTHEEAWFLMETRWALYFEDGDTLRLFAGVPRAWLQPGAKVGVTRGASTFGPLDLRLEVAADGREVTATVTCTSPRRPRTLSIRIPHPDGRTARGATGGTYDPAGECVRVADFSGHAVVRVAFA